MLVTFDNRDRYFSLLFIYLCICVFLLVLKINHRAVDTFGPQILGVWISIAHTLDEGLQWQIVDPLCTLIILFHAE